MSTQKAFIYIIFLVSLSVALSLTHNDLSNPQNVLGNPLKVCSTSPMTGFNRDGYCSAGPTDYGTHVACARVTNEFLEFTKGRGNDLSTPIPEYGFVGLKDGDRWCLCALRWKEALLEGKAPPLDLDASYSRLLDFVSL